MASYPLVYIGRSSVIGKPVTVIVAEKGNWKMYNLSNPQSVADSSDEYGTEAKNMYNEPSTGIANFPVSTRNPLGIEVEVREGLSQAEITSLLRQLRSVTPKEVRDAYDKMDSD
jgi:hypothetical protein